MKTPHLKIPSRSDAMRLRRSEKIAMMWMYQVGTVLEEVPKDLEERLEMIENGKERVKKLQEDSEALIEELRVTIPEAQRVNLHHTAQDYEMRMLPKATPSKNSVVLQKEEYRTLVDFARAKCHDCSEDDIDCEKCPLYQILTVIQPIEDYHLLFLCPYNLGEWKN